MPIRLLPKEPDRVCTKIFATRGMAAEIARACGIHRASVYEWRKVPPQHVMTVSPILGIPPEKIRPDIFGAKRKKSS